MGFTEQQLRDHAWDEDCSEIVMEVERRRHFLVVPNCCSLAQTSRAVFLRINSNDYYYSERNSADPIDPPKWKMMTLDERSIEVQHCPFCGTKMPEIQPVTPPGPVCVCTDGGYYCDTCKNRLHACCCYPPEAAWGIKQ